MQDARLLLDGFLLSLSSSSHPRICLLPTSSGDGDRLVDGGFTPGYAEDGVPLDLVGAELHEVVTSRGGARAYRGERGAEAPIDTTLP